MNRRLVNLVLADYHSRIRWLYRLDVAKHLFYPSTAQAEAANAKQESNNNGGGGGDMPPRLKWPKPPRIKWLGRLPDPSMFQSPLEDDSNEEPEPCRPWPSYDDDDACTILHSTRNGCAVIYDADARAINTTVPSFDAGMGREPITFSVPGAGGEKESLYVMRSTIRPPVRDRYSPHPPPNNGSSGGEDRCSSDFVILDLNQQPYEWQHLPRPPFVFAKDWFEPVSPAFYIRSTAVVDGGRNVVVSLDKEKANNGGVVEFTYCFDTTTRQWRHAGNWALPFSGRSEYVPELGAWIGLSSTPPHHLCVADLSGAMADAHGRAPTPQHVWDDFTPPPRTMSSAVLNQRHPQFVLRRETEWRPSGHSLVNLGSGRFCTLKVFYIRRSERVGFYQPDEHLQNDEEFAVLTGVEVVRCHDGEEGALRMVKHKSKRCVLNHNMRAMRHWLF